MGTNKLNTRDTLITHVNVLQNFVQPLLTSNLARFSAKPIQLKP